MDSNAMYLNDEAEWALDSLDVTSIDFGSIGIDPTNLEFCSFEQTGSKKRARNEPSGGPKSKACREKMRRDKLNDRFQELGSILDPGRPPKTDKSMILSDAARALVQLRSEAEQLKEANEKLQEAIKDLKAEKNELRDEKMRLKADKERLEEQMRALSAPPPGYMPHPVAYHAAAMAAFTAQAQAAVTNKTGHYYMYPAVPFNQLMPSSNTDCTQDTKHVSPNA